MVQTAAPPAAAAGGGGGTAPPAAAAAGGGGGRKSRSSAGVDKVTKITQMMDALSLPEYYGVDHSHIRNVDRCPILNIHI